MNRFAPGFVAGAVLSALVFALLSRRSEAPPPPPAPGSAQPPSAVAKEENDRLREKIQELEAQKKASDARTPAAKPATPAAPEIKLEARFGALVEKGFAGMAGPGMRELLDAVKASGAPALAFLASRLREGSTSQERFLAAAALEGAGDPAALPALAEALRKDSDELVRRMASHAIAVMGAEGGETPLRSAMTGDKDWGVRVNSAYGLAKLGRDDGLRMLEDSYAASGTPPEYRLAILGGLADVAAPSTAPLFRRILSDTTDAAYLLTAVGALGKMKDAASRADLERLAATEGVPESVREAARKVVESLR